MLNNSFKKYLIDQKSIININLILKLFNKYYKYLITGFNRKQLNKIY